MSLAAAWLLANAQVISASADGKLWHLDKQYSPVELVLNLGCELHHTYLTNFWCVTHNAFYLVTLVGQQQYAQRFSKVPALKHRENMNRWFGRRINHQQIDGYRIVSYTSSFQADALVRGYRLHNSERIAFYREIKHGRYHLVTFNPEADIFIVQQGNTAHTFVIQANWAEPY